MHYWPLATIRHIKSGHITACFDSPDFQACAAQHAALHAPLGRLHGCGLGFTARHEWAPGFKKACSALLGCRLGCPAAPHAPASLTLPVPMPPTIPPCSCINHHMLISSSHWLQEAVKRVVKVCRDKGVTPGGQHSAHITCRQTHRTHALCPGQALYACHV